jgi:GH24 family phage-related lysozyme (muramidase)
MHVENSIKAGYDSTSKLWYPHDSLEGGRPTIGYGHKLKEDEDFSEGLTTKQVIKLFKEDFEDHKDLARKGFGREMFDLLPEKYQNVIINIVFNVGSFNRRKWPKLCKAIEEFDEPTIRKEMVTSYKTPDGQRIYLLGRATIIANCLNLRKD